MRTDGDFLFFADRRNVFNDSLQIAPSDSRLINL